MRRLINPNTGSIDTVENWKADFDRMSDEGNLNEWFGLTEFPQSLEELEEFCWDIDLIEVDEHGQEVVA